jgi:hypothetical protein
MGPVLLLWGAMFVVHALSKLGKPVAGPGVNYPRTSNQKRKCFISREDTILDSVIPWGRNQSHKLATALSTKRVGIQNKNS